MDMQDSVSNSYSGKLLLATPTMVDVRFFKAVIFLCSHSTQGAMGVIINKPSVDIRFIDLLKQLKINYVEKSSYPTIYYGGPVEHGRGFVVHSSDYSDSKTTVQINEYFCLTATLDIINDIAEGCGPLKRILTLGCAGWAPGQLEHEISSDSWIVCDSNIELLFETEYEKKWEKGLASLGIKPSHLSSFGGSA